MHYAVHRVLFRESIFSVYAVIIPVRPLFATSSLVSLTAGTHSDTVFGTALRRACGASCIRLGTITRPSFTQIEMVRLIIMIIIMVARGGIGLQRSLEAAMADST